MIVEVQRRRRWYDEEKLSALSEVDFGGASVVDVARCSDLTRQHIFTLFVLGELFLV